MSSQMKSREGSLETQIIKANTELVLFLDNWVKDAKVALASRGRCGEHGSTICEWPRRSSPDSTAQSYIQCRWKISDEIDRNRLKRSLTYFDNIGKDPPNLLAIWFRLYTKRLTFLPLTALERICLHMRRSRLLVRDIV